MMDIAIVGIGAMGCLFAAYLSPLAKVTMLGHWPEQLAALQSGLTLIGRDGTHREVKVRATGVPQSVGAPTVALVLVKSYQTARAAREIGSFLNPEGLAITLQNGLGNEALLSSRLGPQRVCLGSTTEGATLKEVALVHHAGQGRTVLPELSGSHSDIIQDFAELLRSTGFHVELSADVAKVVWEKLVINAAINPLTALLDVPNGYLVTNGPAKHIVRLAAREAAVVAHEMGVDFTPASAETRALEVARQTKDNLSSMLQDVRKKRPTELEAITGAVRRQGQARRIATPINDALYDLLTLKLGSKEWGAGIDSLPSQLQSLFSALYQDRKHEGT